MTKKSDKIVRLIYASRLAKGCGPKELEAILNVSRENNRDIGVTGALCYSARGFLQCIEGPRESVNMLYRRIVQDERNEDVTLIAYTQNEDERAFGQWSMAYVRADAVDQMILTKHRIKEPFDPYTLQAEQAHNFLCDMARERAAFLSRQQQ